MSNQPRPVEIESVSKSFGDRQVVREVSFAAERGEVLGLVGPNGAGKTTTIRMLLDIIKPDSGSVRVFGRPLDEAAKARIGYLPEDRGLYRSLRVWETLVYLASLKGIQNREAGGRANELLERVGLLAHKDKKVAELSRGMGQLGQFAATILHRPDLVVLDEPFAALDPLNVRLMKEMIAERRSQGAAFIMSTHQMDQVEELCDRVVMIDQGRVVLYGRLHEIKLKFSDHAVNVVCDHVPPALPGVRSVQDKGAFTQLALEDGVQPQAVLRALVERGVAIERFEVALPSLEDVFMRVAGRNVRSQP
jgi:ABC-2 type transport system ATP-binding protein